MISTKNVESAKKLIKSSKEEPIIVEAQDDLFNRKIIEYGKFNILLSPEKNRTKIGIKKVDSGLNHVVAKIATKNKIKIGIDLKEISKLNKQEKALRLLRIKQNISFCKKAKTKLALINIKDKKDASSFLLSLGASTAQAKQALSKSF